MKDAEYIYSLYVQANPVPDPLLLPLSRDEAALLTSEGSPDMITEEQANRPNSGTSTRRRRLVAAAGAAVVLIAAIAAVALVAGGGTTVVAAEEADPVMTFDGSVCIYSGPELIEEGMVEFSMTNSADVEVVFARLEVGESDLREELDAFPVGSEDTGIRPNPEQGTLSYTLVAPGESVVRQWPMSAAFYVLDCATIDPTDHRWRAAQIEVVAP